MAIALSLIAEMAQSLQGAVDWLAGGPAPRKDDASSRPGLPVTAGRPQPQPTPSRASGSPRRRWGGPTRIDEPKSEMQMRWPSSAACAPAATNAARVARVVRVGAGGVVVSGRIDEVCAELDRLAAMEAMEAMQVAH